MEPKPRKAVSLSFTQFQINACDKSTVPAVVVTCAVAIDGMAVAASITGVWLIASGQTNKRSMSHG